MEDIQNENDHTLTSHDSAVSDVKVDSDVVQAAVDAASSVAIPPPQAAPDVGVTEEMMLPPPLDGTGIVVTTAEEMDDKMHEEDDDVAVDMDVAAMPSLTVPGETPTEISTLSTPNKLSSKQERMDAIWLKHYKELQEYKVQNNHVRVPRKSGPLGEWVRTQRRYYKLWRRGETVPLNKERMEMLDQLGFVWLPAEEKVGGGFRGGRPKKRKREEEDVLNAVAAAAMVAGTDGSAAGVVGPNGTMFYNLAAPGLEATMNEDGTMVHMAATEGNLGDEGITLTAADNTDGSNGATLATAASVAAATPMTTIPYNFHQDPFYLHSMAKRADITNQISLLEKHESINRQQPTYNAQGGANVNETFNTPKLADAHSHYEDVVYVLKRANEELRDAELALDRAKKTYDSAQELKDKADVLLANASEDVLNAELDDGDDEWIGMYKCLVNYKEQNGNILFPRVSNAGGSGKDSNGDEEDDAPDEEDGDVDTSTKLDESGNDVSYGTVNTVVVATTNVSKAEDSEVADTAVAAAEGTEAEKDATTEQTAKTEDMDIECPVDTTTDAPAATKDNATDAEPAPVSTTVNVTEAVLHDWVARMRKFPKKQFKKWRRYALDKLGFVW